MDAVWGLAGGAAGGGGVVAPGANADGDVGADGVGVEVKNMYVDFTPTLFPDINFKVGVQGLMQSRGFFFFDDFAGLVATYQGDNFTLPFVWMKAYEGTMALNTDSNSKDVDIYGLNPTFAINDLQLNPFVFWLTSDNIGAYHPSAKP